MTDTKVYLVGGAVRDRLLGLEPKEQDWVVTGATPEQMQERGFRQVGKSFPVFLHPKNGEEYALARTERKQGHGYHGFTVDFGPEVTLEQDLERRDLTINAIAQDENGELIDPWGGQQDLEARVIRHVSPAFVEDPLRVLRVARFAARFHGLGFRVHESTLALMRDIAAAGELEHLVPERAWREIDKGLCTDHPSVFLSTLRASAALDRILPEVDRLYGIPQPERYHPEVDTGVHLEMALDMAAGLGAGSAVMTAVLLHDLGKGVTDPGRWPAHHGHEAAGVPLVEAVCERFAVPTRVRRLSLQVCRHHLDCHRLIEARPVTVMKLLDSLDAMRSRSVDDFVLACESDYRGRKGLQDRAYPQGDRLQAALAAALSVQASDLDLTGLKGPQVGEALHAARIEAVSALSAPGEE